MIAGIDCSHYQKAIDWPKAHQAGVDFAIIKATEGNGDDGATYTDDGIHPNAAGYQLTANQWQNVLGL